MSQRIIAALQPFVDRHALAGAVTLVTSKSETLALDAVGWADIAAKRPMRADDLFWIASMTKPVTATAVMMLVDKGRLSLDDPVEKHLPEFQGQMFIAEKSPEENPERVVLKRPSHPPTLREALSHTGGFAFKSPMETPTLDRLTIADAVRGHAALPLVYEPGTKYQYSNAGINTAARVLEVVSGMGYEEFLKRRLLRPLGMKDTTFRPTPAQAARVAKSYKVNESKTDLEETPISQLSWPLTDRRRQPMPAGGLFSTAEDCARFCRMLMNGGKLGRKRYVSEQSVREMTRKQTSPALPDEYGLGFSTADASFGHGGAHFTNMTVYPDLGIAAIYMVQHVDFPTSDPAVRNENFVAFKKAVREEFFSS